MSQELVIIPLYNEEQHIRAVLEELRRHYLGHILLINDGSADNSTQVLLNIASNSVRTMCHSSNQGYGASLMAGFNYAVENDYKFVVTMDCDWQHEPQCIPLFLNEVSQIEVVSGSRYLKPELDVSSAPPDREEINRRVTSIINQITGFHLTDAFCGFKAYQVKALAKLKLDERGYGFPLQFWIQAAHFGLRVKEIAVPRIYLDFSKTFPGELGNAEKRMNYYFSIIEKERVKWKM